MIVMTSVFIILCKFEFLSSGLRVLYLTSYGTTKNSAMFILVKAFMLFNLFIFISSYSVKRVFYTKYNRKVQVYDGRPVDDAWIARGKFNNKINKTGFAYLEMKTNPKYGNREQAYHAGYLEGQLTSNLIYSRWVNTVQDFYKIEKKHNSTSMNNFIAQNDEWIRKQVSNSTDPYWHQVDLFYVQLKGLYHGYNNNTNPKTSLTWNDILWLNLLTEFPDVLESFKNHTLPVPVGSEHCSVLIKIMPGYQDVYFGHNTWNRYQDMLRIQKRYVLSYTTTENGTDRIPGYQMTTSSYPGAITSLDDYYLISSGLAVTETSYVIFNKKLLRYISPEDSIWEGVRSMVANRLAVDGKTWTDIYKLHNSGTYNNQWMVFDYKKFKRGAKLPKGSFWVSEQIPSKIVAKDLTHVLNDVGYWSSYNIPYFRNIYEISGYVFIYKLNGDWFSHEKAPRAEIFKRDQGNVDSMDSFMALMRSNDFRNEPFAYCKCKPPYSATGAIAARSDLNPPGGIRNAYEAAGATDAKITNSQLFIKLQFMAVSGPTAGTDDKLGVFKWSTSNFTNTPHLSHPDVWDFKPELHKWTLK